jgi:hypothetical protein
MLSSIEATWLSADRKKQLAADFQRDPSWNERAPSVRIPHGLTASRPMFNRTQTLNPPPGASRCVSEPQLHHALTGKLHPLLDW